MNKVLGVALTLAAVALVGLMMMMTGIIPRPGGSAYPACETLPTVAEVERAVQDHQPLVDELQAVGEGVRVEVTQPCVGEDAAAVTVWYADGDEETGIDRIMAGDGFGVVAVPRQR